MTEDSYAIQKELFGDLQKNWGWLLAWGIMSIVLGVIGLGMTFALTVASVLFFGVLILIGGVIQFVHAFKCKGWQCFIWYLLIAVFYILAGVSIMRNPVAASMVFTLLLAGAILALPVIVAAYATESTTGSLEAGLIAGLIIAVSVFLSWITARFLRKW